jgi:Asp-tRNA(Asn)/Glu-tRNA(Gln) amidotransferase A subunit family amidase
MPTIRSLQKATRQMRTGELDPVQLVEECLARIDRYEGQIQAWVLVDAEGARRAAQQMAVEAAKGLWRGPLHGIPLGIKDLFDVAGWPTRAGSPLRAQWPSAQADAPLVASLRAAGAILLGKTVTVEFACFDPPPTRNPWDPKLSRTPGGSSSGSAAALALGMCLGALGTQTGGSLVRPSSYCGTATCKPTFGRLSTEGVVPVSYHLDHPGPMARQVTDLEILLEVLLPGFTPAPPRSGPPRLGLVENFFLERVAAVQRAAFDAALDRLRAAGAQIEPVRLPIDFQEILDLHWRIMAVEAAEFHRRTFAEHPEGYGPKITTLLRDGLQTPAVDYAAALAHQRWLRRTAGQLVGPFDALVTPSTDSTAPGLETTGPRDFQAPWSYAGLPVVAIPCGLAADRMPSSLQLIARPQQEAALLATAKWCEDPLRFDALPPW